MGSSADFEGQLRYWNGQLGTLRKLLTKYEEDFKQVLGTLIQSYESQILTLIPTLVDLPDDNPDDVINTTMLAHIDVEREKLEKRRQELREVLIPQELKNADACIADSQTQREKRHQENTTLYEKQDELQKEKAALERQFQEMNDEIRSRARGLGIVWNYFAIRKLRKNRAKVQWKLREAMNSLHEMRRKWQVATKEMTKKEMKLRLLWDEINLSRGRYQAELDILDDPEQFERLAQTQAARTWLDALRTPVTGPNQTDSAALQDPINALVELNLKGDTYREAVAMATQLNAICQAIDDGLEKMDATMRKLIAQERKYSQYLPRLSFTMPGAAETFNKQWPALLEQLKDQEHFKQNPQEFTQIAQETLEKGITNDLIKTMFESLGEAINQATKRWGKR
ncbi:MAG: hypothetical protein JXA21_14880 [Anaerolineae bacterium]|nr:hypothetical protein [Anaerolineae bacterium]